LNPVTVLKVRFYRTADAKEPVREWLTEMGRPNKTLIGADIKTVQIGWPLGMPLVRKLEAGLWEVRSHFPEGIVRVLFTVQDSTMVLLHGFVKKSQKTPASDLKLAKQRKKEVDHGQA
jgi:phage-related protein